MGAADEQRLAPVTWLFGTPPPVDAHEQRSAAAPEPSITSSSDEGDRREGRFDRISNVSMHALARRGMSSQEMRQLLVSREFELLAVDDEVARLEGVGLLNDGELAKTLVRTLRDRKGLGKTALVSELRRRRLDAAAIDTALGELDDNELQLAIELAIKRAPQVRSLDSATANRRLGAFLMRKGYSGSVVSAAVAQALSTPDAAARRGPVFR
jgi:SOS response regulatory protein OraA/RecX